jgi:fibronectin type 3 domain-containing protein
MSTDEKVAGYIIQRADADSDKFCDLIDLEGLEVAGYRDRDGVSVSKKLAGLKDNTAYKYRILAYNIADVRSPWSEPVFAVTKPAPSKPEMPDAISGTARAIELLWKPCPEKDIAQYVLECREKDAGKFKEITKTAAATFKHAGLKDGATYIYRIKAIDKDLLESVYSDEAMATTKPLPGTPKDLTAEACSTGEFKIKWLAPAQKDIKTYRLYKSGLFSGKLLKETDKTECVLEESVVGKSIKVSVSAVDIDGLESVMSSEIEIKPQAK